MSSKTIAKNSIFLLISSVFQKVVSFIYFMYLTRHLPADSVGKYAFSISFAFMFCVFMDFGTNSFLIKDISRDEKDLNKNVNNVFVLEIILGIIFILVSALSINIIGYPEITKSLVYIGILTVFLDNLTTTFYATLRGKQELWFESIGYAFYQIIVLSLGIFFVVNNYPLIFLALPPLLAASLNLIYSIIIAKKRSSFKFNLKFNKSEILEVAKFSLPFALTGIFTKLYTSIDTFLLSRFSTDEHIAYYQAPYKLIFALQFVPIAIGSAIFPAFSKYFKDDKEKLKTTFLKSFVILSVIAIPLSFVFTILAKEIILLVYPNYLQSVAVLQIFAFSFFFIFLNTPVGLLVSACDRQKITTRNSFIAMITNLILNLVLIPIYDIRGAAMASLVSFFILFSLNFIEAKKTIDFSTSYLLKNLLKIIFSCIIMSVVIIFLKDKMHFLLAATIGAIIYSLLIELFGVFRIKQILELLLKK